jgi:hypothetical protein
LETPEGRERERERGKLLHNTTHEHLSKGGERKGGRRRKKR